MSTATYTAWSLALVVMLVGPLILGSWFWRRYNVRPIAFLYGALAFVVMQLVIRLPLIQVLSPLFAGAVQPGTASFIVYLAAMAFSAGLFETAGRWAGYRWLFPGRLPYDWEHGVAYGIGHGGIESVLLVGGSSALNFVQGLVLTATPVEQLQSQYSGDLLAQVLQARDLYAQLAWYEPLLAAVERIATVPLHMALSLVVLLAFTRGQARWIWYAVLIHGLADFATLLLSQVLRWPMWAVEIAIVGWGAASVWYIIHRYRESRNEMVQRGEA